MAIVEWSNWGWRGLVYINALRVLIKWRALQKCVTSRLKLFVTCMRSQDEIGLVLQLFLVVKKGAMKWLTSGSESSNWHVSKTKPILRISGRVTSIVSCLAHVWSHNDWLPFSCTSLNPTWMCYFPIVTNTRNMTYFLYSISFFFRIQTRLGD